MRPVQQVRKVLAKLSRMRHVPAIQAADEQLRGESRDFVRGALAFAVWVLGSDDPCFDTPKILGK